MSVQGETTDRILTVPNILSFARIVLIPVFVVLLLNHGTELSGLLLLGAVTSTDWVDGYVARRTGQVSELGKRLDPVADRLAIAAALVVFVIRGALPLWAALLILVRDAAVLLAGVFLIVTRRPLIDVRFIGKVGTFVLMTTVPAIAWGNFGLPLDNLALAVGWTFFWVGLIEYYAATVVYAFDVRDVMRTQAGKGVTSGTGVQGSPPL